MLSDKFCAGVQYRGHQKEHHRGKKKCAIEGASKWGFGYFYGNIGKERAHPIKWTPIHDGGVSGCHKHDHGFTYGPAKSNHDSSKQTGAGGRQYHPPNGFPATRSKGQGGCGKAPRNIGKIIGMTAKPRAKGNDHTVSRVVLYLQISIEPTLKVGVKECSL